MGRYRSHQIKARGVTVNRFCQQVARHSCRGHAVTRKTLQGVPETGFEPAQKLTRMEALYAMTLAAAYAAFEEQDKGSIEVGKLADLTVLNQDLITVPEAEILNTDVLLTIVGGEVAYQRDENVLP